MIDDNAAVIQDPCPQRRERWRSRTYLSTGLEGAGRMLRRVLGIYLFDDPERNVYGLWWFRWFRGRCRERKDK